MMLKLTSRLVGGGERGKMGEEGKKRKKKKKEGEGESTCSGWVRRGKEGGGRWLVAH